MRKFIAILGILLLALYLVSWLFGKKNSRPPFRTLVMRGLAIIASILLLQGILQTVIGILRGE